MVSGGSLNAKFMSELEVLCEDGPSMLIFRVLDVPDLGVNFLFVRRLCVDSLRGSFNSKRIVFKLKFSDEKVIIANMYNGPYLFLHISKCLQV